MYIIAAHARATSDAATKAKGDDDDGWLERWLGPLPELLLDRCCAQFVVHRDLIRHQPREFYEEALAIMSERVRDQDSDSPRGPNSRLWGLLFEWIWHYAFGMEAVATHDDGIVSLLRSLNQTIALSEEPDGTGPVDDWVAQIRPAILAGIDRAVVGRAPCLSSAPVIVTG